MRILSGKCDGYAAFKALILELKPLALWLLHETLQPRQNAGIAGVMKELCSPLLNVPFVKYDSLIVEQKPTLVA
jgi:hypothetical protein